MPIRMEKDDPGSSQRPGGGGRGRFPKGLGWLALILFLFKKPKWALLVLAIAVAIWYFGGGDLQSLLSETEAQSEGFFLGADLSEERYDEALVFEPLAVNSPKYSLPPRTSLENYCPPRLHQGRQGSCVGWASAYAARTILHSSASGQSPDIVNFSPSYLYNQIALRGCQGAYLVDAMRSMFRNGALPFDEFPYVENSCGREPNSVEIQEGQRYRIAGFNRLSYGASNYKTDLAAIRQNIAQGAPVVIGMQVGGSFMYEMMGSDSWIPNRRDYSGAGFSGHAMCVIGYDDTYNNEGAFQIMNSWGPEWGDNGLFWISYSDFDHFTKEAYGLNPMGQVDEGIFNVQFGLVDNATQQNLEMQPTDNAFVFRNTRPIGVGDKFKIEVTNSNPCYIYVFGQETDGSSYVLFPYTAKHSPYCGIVGTRLFPKDYSMVADELGERDRIAVVVSKTEWDYQALNTRINNSPGDYISKLMLALGDDMISDVQFEAGSTIRFDIEAENKNTVGVVIEIDKS